MMAFRSKIYQILENPKTGIQRGISIFLIGLIFLSIFGLAFRVGYPEISKEYAGFLNGFDRFILSVFSVEYLTRIFVSPKPIKYIFSFGGIIDFLSIFPAIVGFFGIQTRNTSFLRILRIFRFLRVLRLISFKKKNKSIFGNTILGKVFPFLVLAFIAKLFIFLLETKGWWIEIQELETVFAVIGFAIGVILSQKLGIAYGKIIAVEDSVLKITGILTELRFRFKSPNLLKKWAKELFQILDSEKSTEKLIKINDELGAEIQKETDKFEKQFLFQTFQKLSQEIRFLLNRKNIQTPDGYETFLRRITIVYALMILVFLPGLIGLVGVLVATYVLGGMYLVIADMDRAIGHDSQNLINADYSDLENLIQEWES